MIDDPRPANSRRFPVTALGVVAVLAACATSPLGRSQLCLFSEREMSAMGSAAFAEMQAEMPVTNAADVNDYVDCVVEAIVRPMPADSIEWEVAVFDDDRANAFALPGGKIGVYRGLLDVAENQSQLAAVIGHEIGHVMASHANERLSTGTLTQIGVQVVAVISGGPSPQRDRTLAALGLGVQVGLLLPFSRTQEEEADLIGLDLMTRAGFDPRESIELWQNMAEQSKHAPPEFLSTHPSSDSRMRALNARMPWAESIRREALAADRRPSCEPARPDLQISRSN